MYAALFTPPIICEIYEKSLGTRTFNFVLRADECPLDRDLQDLLVDQRNTTYPSSAARNTRRGFRMVPISRIQTIQVVHMGPTHARLAWMEINDLIVSSPLVDGLPR